MFAPARLDHCFDEPIAALATGGHRSYTDGMASPTRGRHRLVTEQEWKVAVAAAAPTRTDDTVVLSGGRRATLEEVQAYVAEDLARRAAQADG